MFGCGHPHILKLFVKVCVLNRHISRDGKVWAKLAGSTDAAPT